MLNKIRIVLVETSHAGNIGAAARAMLSMGISRLYLVNPKTPITEKSYALATHADDIISNALVVANLPEALEGVDFVVGTSARERRFSLPLVSAEQACHTGLNHCLGDGAEMAIVFGRERTGLYNEELLMCHVHSFIPTCSTFAARHGERNARSSRPG
ncbi:MAG: RNA methyltransferase [Francisellaceae bacterium]